MMGGMGGMASGSQLSIIPGWLIVAAIAFATVIGLISGFFILLTVRSKFPHWKQSSMNDINKGPVGSNFLTGPFLYKRDKTSYNKRKKQRRNFI